MLDHIIATCFACWLFVNALNENGTSLCKAGNIDVCCADYEERDGRCIACPRGTKSDKGTNCTRCGKPFYGPKCLNECKCAYSQECHHEYGCISTTTEDASVRYKHVHLYEGSEDNHGLNTMTTLSITIAILALMIVMTTAIAKCYNRIVGKQGVIKAITTTSSVNSHERKINIYGTKTKISTEDDEYEFDRDNYEDEEPYAVIRDSHVLSSLVTTDEHGEIYIQYDECPQYDTTDYNHLNVMGSRNTPRSQNKYVSNYSDAVFGNQMLTFKD